MFSRSCSHIPQQSYNEQTTIYCVWSFRSHLISIQLSFSIIKMWWWCDDWAHDERFASSSAERDSDVALRYLCIYSGVLLWPINHFFLANALNRQTRKQMDGAKTLPVSDEHSNDWRKKKITLESSFNISLSTECNWLWRGTIANYSNFILHGKSYTVRQ